MDRVVRRATVRVCTSSFNRTARAALGSRSFIACFKPFQRVPARGLKAMLTDKTATKYLCDDPARIVKVSGRNEALS